MNKQPEIGIINVYKVARPLHHNPTNKLKNHQLPIIFKVRFKRGAEPCYINYPSMKQQYPDMLFHFFQQRVFFTQTDQELLKEGLEQQDHLLEHRQSKKQESQRNLRRRSKRSSRRNSLGEISRQYSREHDYSHEKRPIRGCRMNTMNLQPAKKKQNFMNEGQNQHFRHRQTKIIEEHLEHKESELKKSQQIINDLKKILDYDYLTQSQGRHTLISPAAYPIKNKLEAIPPTSSVSPYPHPMPLGYQRSFQRESYSEEIKQSEESEFILDERGKQKRKKQKMMREQQRIIRKKKSRKIKKKSKSSGGNSKH